MNVSEFVAKWRQVELTERSASQQHFLDLCELVDHPKPAQDNERPTWLDLAHRKLDQVVFAAYGWEPTLSDDEILTRLLALNQQRAAAD